MPNVVVYHPLLPAINNGYTFFSGKDVNVTKNEDGSITINKWVTHTEHGYAIFAKDVWSYVILSEKND